LNPAHHLACHIPGRMNLREIGLQDDGASPHRAKETKEALNAVCVTVTVTVSGANLH
jgi:hypothetical protein